MTYLFSLCVVLWIYLGYYSYVLTLFYVFYCEELLEVFSRGAIYL